VSGRHRAAAERLEQLVAEMKRVGVWSDTPPPPEAFDFRGAFGSDTMSFEQWLQFVLVPRVRQIVDEGGTFPADSQLGDKAHREWRMWGNEPEREPLIEMLYELDALIRAFARTVRSFRLFEGTAEPPPYPERPYAARFARAETRFVYWEAVLDHPAPGRRVPVEFESVYFRPDGSEWARQTLPTTFEPGWTWSHHFYRWGWEAPGHWVPGRYRVAVRLWDEELAAGEFELG
jgi:uncharacterized protein YqcC (DUF446 family)